MSDFDHPNSPPIPATPGLPVAPAAPVTPATPVASTPPPFAAPAPAPLAPAAATAASATDGEASPLDLENRVIEVLRTVYDPEIPVNIYELGMIYKVDVTPPSAVHVKMTLTSPMCPVAGTLPGEVQDRIKNLHGVTDAQVELVWEPPWNPAMMTEAARLDLGMM